MSDALASPYHAAGEASVKNTDQTGWSEKNWRRGLWGAATATFGFVEIHLQRSDEGLQALPGWTPRGFSVATTGGPTASCRWSDVKSAGPPIA